MPIAHVALPVAAETTFDYWCPESLALVRGSVVRVRLGTRNLVGVVTAVADAPRIADVKLAPIADVLDVPRVADDVLDAACTITPGFEGPTISALARPGWQAVRALVPRGEAQQVMDDLRALGARAILVTDIAACRF